MLIAAPTTTDTCEAENWKSCEFLAGVEDNIKILDDVYAPWFNVMRDAERVTEDDLAFSVDCRE